MSPSEFDLRGALSDGDGEGIDVEALIGHASAVQRARQARRVRWATAAAVIVVAGGIGTGLTVLNDHSPTKSASAGGAFGTAQTSAAGTPAPRDAAGPAYSTDLGPYAGSAGTGDGANTAAVPNLPAAAPTCASTVPKPPAPSLSASGAARLLPSPVSGMLVCGYDGAGKLARLANGTEVFATFTGSDAQAIAASLEAASASKVQEFCPNVQRQIATVTIAATDSAGRPAVLVVAVPYCGGSVTNGDATRYDWTPPDQLTNLLNAKQPFSR